MLLAIVMCVTTASGALSPPVGVWTNKDMWTRARLRVANKQVKEGEGEGGRKGTKEREEG